MQAIEFETHIDPNGHIHLPEKYHHAYGRLARFVVLLPEQTDSSQKRQPGSAKGILQVLSEDDDHLKDFEGYML